MTTRTGAGPEARTTPRIAVRLSAEVLVEGRAFTATTRDVSIGGVCIETSQIINEGQPLQLGLFLVDDDVEDASQPPLQMLGKVAWAAPGEDGRPGSMGVRFEGVSAAQLQGLTRFLKLVPQGG